MTSRFGATALVTGAVVAAMAATTVTAQAQDRQVAPRPAHAEKVLTATMTTHKIRQTRTSGARTVVTLDNGQRIEMSAATYRHARAALASRPGGTLTPNNTVSGNCGTATVTLDNAPNNRQYKMSTGFHVDAPATSYGWSVYINGSGGTHYDYHYHASGDLAFRTSWAGSHTDYVPASDAYEAEIDISGSWAFLVTDTMCTAGMATDGEYII